MFARQLYPLKPNDTADFLYFLQKKEREGSYIAKIDWHYDPWAAYYSNLIKGQADKISNLAAGYDTHSPLTDLGKSELQKIISGKSGDTMLAGVARNAAARDVATAKDSMQLGTASMRAGANNPNSLLSHDRLLRRATNEANNRSADLLVRAMPGYASEVGGWANTDNDLLSQRIAAEAGATGALGTAAGVMSAGTVAKEKKGFWGSLFGNINKNIETLGQIAAGAQYSDKNTKEDIHDSDDAKSAKRIKKTKVKKFKYKEGYDAGDGQEKTGVVAQEHAKVAPEQVVETDRGVKAVDYRSLFMDNVGATKHLMTRVEKLEKAQKRKGKK